jgi:hypothetical protein
LQLKTISKTGYYDQRYREEVQLGERGRQGIAEKPQGRPN